MNNEGNSGYPERRGLYECSVDGQKKYLILHRCDITGKARWSDTRGYDVVGCEIKYFRGPLKASDLDKK